MSTASTPSQSRLEALKKKQAQLAEQIKTIESRDQQQKRKDDTRRKVIAGAIALEHAAKNPDSEFARDFTHALEHSVMKNAERKLFGLKLKPEKETK